MFARPEGWPSGLRRTPGERVGALPLVGSNPTPSASCLIMSGSRPSGHGEGELTVSSTEQCLRN